MAGAGGTVDDYGDDHGLRRSILESSTPAAAGSPLSFTDLSVLSVKGQGALDGESLIDRLSPMIQ